MESTKSENWQATGGPDWGIGGYTQNPCSEHFECFFYEKISP